MLKTNLTIGSLKQNKESVTVVREGEECGVILNDFQDFNIGDYLDGYEIDKKFEGISETKTCLACYT